MRKIAAVILAAGRGTRFATDAGESKLVADLDGKPLVRHVALAALAARPRPVFVVTGHAAAHVEAALANLDVVFVENPDYAAGLSTSVKAGLTALTPDIDGALILLADMPRISASLINRMATAFQAADPAPKAVVPVLAGQRGNPVLVARDMFAHVAQITGDKGARALLDAASLDLLEVPVTDLSVTLDIDTRTMLDAARVQPQNEAERSEPN